MENWTVGRQKETNKIQEKESHDRINGSNAGSYYVAFGGGGHPLGVLRSGLDVL